MLPTADIELELKEGLDNSIDLSPGSNYCLRHLARLCDDTAMKESYVLLKNIV
jgi:hypothetical protein